MSALAGLSPCDWQGHAYAYAGVTGEGRQVFVCPRCGATWRQWTSNGTDAAIQRAQGRG